MTVRESTRAVLSRWGRVAFAAAALWQFVSWGGRIGLLTDAERFDAWNWTRIGGSLLLGVLLAVIAIRGGSVRWVRGVAIVFLVFSLGLWGRSLINVWTDDANSLAFNLVHTALAITTWTLATLCVVSSRRAAVWHVSVGGQGAVGKEGR